VHAQETRADVIARDPENLEKDEAPASADADGLRRFLRADELPWLETWKNELANRPLIRELAFGEALDTSKLERLGRYAAPQGATARGDRRLIRLPKTAGHGVLPGRCLPGCRARDAASLMPRIFSARQSR
jgi:hypothetical protein